MPAAIPVISAALATKVGMFIATMAVSMALGSYQQSRARKKARAAEQAQRDAYNASLKDRNITIRSGVATRKYVLGTVRTGGTLMHIEANGTHNTALDSVLALAANQCELVGYYIGDEYVAPADFPGEHWGKRKEIDQRTSTTVVASGAGTVTITLPHEPVPGSVKATGYTYNYDGGYLHVSEVRITGTEVEVDYFSDGQGEIYLTYKSYAAEKIRVQFKNGSPDQVVTDWDGVETPLWTEDHRLRGVAHLRTLNLWDEDLYHSGAPQMGAVLRGGGVDGHPFFDPRTGTNPAYTTNPAILAAWWMTLPRARGGMGIPESWIDWPFVSAAANICDELITVRRLDGEGYEQIKRYECNTLLDTGNPPIDNLNIIMSAMAGEYVFTAGMYRIFAGAFRPATITITDDDVAGEKDLVMDRSGQDDAPANLVTSTFVNAARNWLESSPRAIRNEDYIAADGAESPLDMPLPATTDERQAAYLMGVALESARPSFVGDLTVLGIGEDIAVMDTVQLSLSNRPEYAGRTFQVVNRIDRWDGTFELKLIETRANVWALDPDNFLPTDPTPVPDTSYLWDIAPVTGFTVDAHKPQALADGTAVVRIDFGWDLHTQPYVRESGRIEIRYRLPGGDWIYTPPAAGSETGTSITASMIDGAPYQFQARAISAVGAVSNWVDQWVEYDGVIEAPPALASLSASGVVMGIDLAWSFPGARNALRHTELRYSTTSSFDDSVSLGEFAWPTDRHSLVGLAHGVQLWFWGRLVDENGTVSPWYPSETGAGVLGQSSTDTTAIQGYITQQIVTSALGAILMADIESIPGIQAEIADLPQIRNALDDIPDIQAEIADLPDIRAILAQHGIDIGQIDDAINNLEAQLADLAGAPDWDNATAYLTGQIVKDGGALYRAKINVPAGTPTSNATYWEKIGDYDSLGEAVSALLVRMLNVETELDDVTGDIVAMSQEILALQADLLALDGTVQGQAAAIQTLETEVSEIDGEVQAQARETSMIRAQLRDEDDGEGRLADVLNQHESFARITQTREVIATNERAQATVNQQMLGQIAGNTASIDDLSQVVATNDQATATRFSQLEADLGTVEDDVTGNALAIGLIQADVTRIDGEIVAQATDISELTATVVVVDGKAVAAQDAADAAQDAADDALAGVTTNSAQITSLSQTVADNESAQSSVNSSLSASIGAAQTAADDAASAAQAASDLAGGKGKVFFQNSAPTVADREPQNLWIDTTAGENTPKRWDGSAWVAVTDKVAVDAASAAAAAQTTANGAAAAAQAASDLAGGKGKVLFQSSTPSTSDREPQNLWIDTTGGANAPKRWDGSAWVAVTDKVATDAVAAANAAQATANAALADAATANASINSLSQTVVNNEQATALRFDTLETDLLGVEGAVSGNATAIQGLQTDVAELDGEIQATAQQSFALRARLRDDGGEGDLTGVLNTHESRAQIVETRNVLATEKRAQAEINLQLGAQIAGNASSISELTQVVATNDQATATRFGQLESSLGALDGTVQGQAGAISLLQTDVTRIDGEVQSQATSIGQLTADVADNASAIQTVSQTIADDKSAQAAINVNLQASVAAAQGDATAAGAAATAAQGTANAAVSAAQDASDLAGGKGKVFFQSSAPSVADRLPQNLWIDTTGSANTPKRWDGSAWVAVTDKAATDAMAAAAAAQADANTNAATIQTINQTIADNESAQALVNSTLQTAVGDVETSVQAISTSVTDITGKFNAAQAVKLAVSSGGTTYTAGYGIGLSNETGVTQSQFVVVADRFAVMHNINGEPVSVFAVQGGASIINTAIIGNASIGSAKFTDWLESDTMGPGGVPVLRLNFRTGEIQMNSPVSGGGRMTLSNQVLQVFDASNNLRVRLGIW